MARGKRGSSLAEFTIATFVFSLLLTTVFLLFGTGSRGFQSINERQDAQSQLSAVRAALQTDLQVTHFYGIFSREANSITVGEETISRDGLSCVALDSWAIGSNFGDAGTPLWNRWVVYRVTQEENGQLMRHVIEAGPGETGLALLKEPALLFTMVNDANPSRVGWRDVGLSGTQGIAQNIKDFKVTLDQKARAVDIKIQIRKESSKPNAKPEQVGANFFIQPHNTGPID